jgi:hypothetical protein
MAAHACNPSYSGGTDQEDLGSEPAWANSLREAILKYPVHKGAGEVTQAVECALASVRPSVQTPVLPRKKKKEFQKC